MPSLLSGTIVNTRNSQEAKNKTSEGLTAKSSSYRLQKATSASRLLILLRHLLNKSTRQHHQSLTDQRGRSTFKTEWYQRI